ncbi:MAG: hydrogen peroxide-inducible genes activator [Pseudomonadota bacterium]
MDGPISLKQLRYLVALADVGHFRKAAESAGITQPSLSAQIANLEEALRLKLVERGRGPTTFTVAGREIVARARRILDEVRGLEDQALALRSGSGGTLRLGTSFAIGPYLMPHVVGRLHKNFPGMGLYVREGVPSDLEQELQDGRHDVILAQLPIRSPDLVAQPMFSEALSVVMAADHPFARRQNLSDGDLAGVPILTLGGAYALNAQVSALCIEAGATLLQHYEGTSLDGLRQMAGMGMGLAFLPALYILSEIEGRDEAITVVPFRGGSFRRSVALAWRRSSGRLSLIQSLAEEVRACIQQLNDPRLSLV